MTDDTRAREQEVDAIVAVLVKPGEMTLDYMGELQIARIEENVWLVQHGIDEDLYPSGEAAARGFIARREEIRALMKEGDAEDAASAQAET